MWIAGKIRELMRAEGPIPFDIEITEIHWKQGEKIKIVGTCRVKKDEPHKPDI